MDHPPASVRFFPVTNTALADLAIPLGQRCNDGAQMRPVAASRRLCPYPTQRRQGADRLDLRDTQGFTASLLAPNKPEVVR